MSYPILYSPTETEFDNNGLGVLSDCILCECIEEANGIFELQMEYDVSGIHYEEIVPRSIIKAKIDRFRAPQLFRVYLISKPLLNVSKIYANHISYDLSGIPVSPFSANNVNDALQGLKQNAAVDCPFDFWTNKSSEAEFSSNVPSSLRFKLGGEEGSILDVYGGEYEFDNYVVRLYNNRGEDRGVSIRYGKNLLDMNQEENCSNVYTGIYPYWYNSEENVLVELEEKIINAPGEYDFVRINTVDLSSEFDEQPTKEALRSAAENYISINKIGVPSVSLSVSFVQLSKSSEYPFLDLMERVSLFDIVNVDFPRMNVSATAKVVRVVYDVLLERFKEITLGEPKKKYTDWVFERIANLEKNVSKLKNKIP